MLAPDWGQDKRSRHGNRVLNVLQPKDSFPLVMILRWKDEVAGKVARLLTLVIPAKAGIQARLLLHGRASQRILGFWVPAFAGTTQGTPPS